MMNTRANPSEPINETGATLIELLLLLLLTSLTLFSLTPLYQSLEEAIILEIAKFHLKQDLRMAKNLASLEERSITLCGSQDGYHCLNEEEERWPGWLLFYDENEQFTPSEDAILHYYPLSEKSRGKLLITTTANIGGGLNISARRNYAYGMARSIANGRINICQKGDINQTSPAYPSFIINVYGYFRLTTKKGSCL